MIYTEEKVTEAIQLAYSTYNDAYGNIIKDFKPADIRHDVAADAADKAFEVLSRLKDGCLSSLENEDNDEVAEDLVSCFQEFAEKLMTRDYRDMATRLFSNKGKREAYKEIFPQTDAALLKALQAASDKLSLGIEISQENDKQYGRSA